LFEPLAQKEPALSAATEFPPDVYIPAAARRRAPLRVTSLSRPVAPAAAALGAEVIDLERWRHHLVVNGLAPDVALDFAAGNLAGSGNFGAGSDLATHLANHPGWRLAPAEQARPAAAPIRLTRRGVVAVMCLAALAAIILVMFAWLSAASSASSAGSATGSGSASGAAPAVVTVKSGDSLWTIAQAVAPSRDPRAEVAQLRAVNHLGSDSLAPGQTLRTR
jgi:hypothetical protein